MVRTRNHTNTSLLQVLLKLWIGGYRSKPSLVSTYFIPKQRELDVNPLKYDIAAASWYLRYIPIAFHYNIPVISPDGWFYSPIIIAVDWAITYQSKIHGEKKKLARSIFPRSIAKEQVTIQDWLNYIVHSIFLYRNNHNVSTIGIPLVLLQNRCICFKLNPNYCQFRSPTYPWKIMNELG